MGIRPEDLEKRRPSHIAFELRQFQKQFSEIAERDYVPGESFKMTFKVSSDTLSQIFVWLFENGWKANCYGRAYFDISAITQEDIDKALSEEIKKVQISAPKTWWEKLKDFWFNSGFHNSRDEF